MKKKDNKNVEYIKKQENVTVIFGDSTDDQGCESICILDEKGNFSSLFSYITNLYEKGGYVSDDDSTYLLGYTQCRIIQMSDNSEKEIKGDFDFDSMYIGNKDLNKLFKNYIGKKIQLNFEMAKDINQLNFQRQVAQANLEKKLLNKNLKKENNIVNRVNKI